VRHSAEHLFGDYPLRTAACQPSSRKVGGSEGDPSKLARVSACSSSVLWKGHNGGAGWRDGASGRRQVEIGDGGTAVKGSG
jgi:hypothetical protein